MSKHTLNRIQICSGLILLLLFLNTTTAQNISSPANRVAYAQYVKAKQLKSVKVTRYQYHNGVADTDGVVIGFANYNKDGFPEDSTFLNEQYGQMLTLSYDYTNMPTPHVYIMKIGVVSIEVQCTDAGIPKLMTAHDLDGKVLSTETISSQPNGWVQVVDATLDSTDTAYTVQLYDDRGMIREISERKGGNAAGSLIVLKNEIQYRQDGCVSEEHTTIPGTGIFSTTYSYDAERNCTSQTTETKEGVGKIEFLYHPNGLPIQAFMTFSPTSASIDAEDVAASGGSGEEPVLLRYQYEYFNH